MTGAQFHQTTVRLRFVKNLLSIQGPTAVVEPQLMRHDAGFVEALLQNSVHAAANIHVTDRKSWNKSLVNHFTSSIAYQIKYHFITLYTVL